MIKVVKYLQECNMVGEPEPTTERGDQSKYYTYHMVTGYDMTECNSSKSVIKQLVQEGLPDKFIKKDIEKSSNIFKKDNKEEEENMHEGGPGMK